MAASLTWTLGTPLGHGTPGGQIAVAMIGRPSLSRAGDTPAVARASTARRFPLAGAGCGGRQTVPGTIRRAVPLRTGRRAGCHATTSSGHDRWPSGLEKGPTMNTNAGSTHRLHGLPGPVAASTAFAANAGAAVPLSRGSPPGRYQARPGLLAVPLAAGAGEHAAAAAGKGRPS